MANSYVFYANKNGRPTGLPGFRGPKGEQGEQGLQGVQGEQGDPGVFIGSEEDMPAGTRVRLDPNGSPDIAAVINDTNISEDETWSSSKINRDLSELMYLEFQSIDTTGLFDGNPKESVLSITDLHPGYKKSIVNINPQVFSINNYVRQHGEIWSDGRFYVEHNLASNCTRITVSVLYVKS